VVLTISLGCYCYRYNKKKYLEIQAAKQSGKKRFHKKKKNNRKSTAMRT